MLGEGGVLRHRHSAHLCKLANLSLSRCSKFRPVFINSPGVLACTGTALYSNTQVLLSHSQGFSLDSVFLTLSAKLIHFMMHHFFGAAAVGQAGVLVEGLEGLAGAVGFGVKFAVLAVGG